MTRQNDPDNWTFYYDEIEQTSGGCGGGDPGGDFPVDFEDDPASYDFGPDGGFGGGASIALSRNPDPSGLNTTAQTAQMQKFAAETFGGSTTWPSNDNVDFDGRRGLQDEGLGIARSGAGVVQVRGL